jgi:transcriptional regulator with XRE-family HTH domain
MAHWTEKSVDDFLYRIATDFVTQLESKIQMEGLNQGQLAEKLGVSRGRVSQLLNNPGNLTLKMIIKCARALGMKIAIVAYDDNDPDNEQGPINSDIFRMCWENSGRPADFWSLTKPEAVAINGAIECTVSKTQNMRINSTSRTSGDERNCGGSPPIHIADEAVT